MPITSKLIKSTDYRIKKLSELSEVPRAVEEVVLECKGSLIVLERTPRNVVSISPNDGYGWRCTVLRKDSK